MSDADKPLYCRAPLTVCNGISVFSEPSAYTANYERIAGDHLESLRLHGTNPFMSEELWLEAEASTAALIRSHARKGDWILDVGVGLGRLLEGFPDLRRFGVDVAQGYLEHAREKGIDVCLAMVEDLPYSPELFDVVVCTDVLEHVLELHQCFKAMLRVLRSGGILVVRAPLRENLAWYLSSDCPYQYVHLRTFDEASLRLPLERVFGCSFVESVTAGLVMRADRLKVGTGVSRLDGALCRVVRLGRRVSPRLGHALARHLFLPIEINGVFRKP